MSTAKAQSAPSALRRSCTFCRTRRIRCSGGHICTACRGRNINCIYGREARKGRPRRTDQGHRHQPSSSLEAGLETGVPLVLGDDSKQTGQADGSLTLGRMLEQMFDEYLICKSGLRSVFRASINIFHRKQQQQQEDRCSRLNYDGLLCFLASDMVEIFVSRFGYLGCESPNFAQQDFYIASLAADTTSNMFDPPKELENPISTLGMHLVMQLVEVCWFSMHPLSPLVSKTLLLSGIKDGTVDETLLAVILADACEIFSNTNTEAKTALHDGDGGKDRGDQTQQTMAYFAAMLLKSRPFPLSELATIPTAQAMVLLGWRDLSLGNARRGSCYVGYACRIASRLHQQLGGRKRARTDKHREFEWDRDK